MVDANYMDARSSGFDHDTWRRLRDEALSRTYRDTPAVYRCVGEGGTEGGGCWLVSECHYCCVGWEGVGVLVVVRVIHRCV